MTNATTTSDKQNRELWKSVLVPLTKKQEMQKRYTQYMDRNAPWIVGLNCFLIGIVLTNAVYQFGLVGFPAWPDLMISLGTVSMCGAQANAALKALKRREATCD